MGTLLPVPPYTCTYPGSNTQISALGFGLIFFYSFAEGNLIGQMRFVC